MAGFVNIKPLPITDGLGAYMISQQSRRVLEGNKVPFGPMVIQRNYPFIQYDRRDSNVGPVMDLQELSPSPIVPLLQNMGPILAAPITVPAGAYADAEEQAEAMANEMLNPATPPITIYLVLGAVFIGLAWLYKKSGRAR